MNLIKWLYELLTGTPWTTTRSMAAEFGPTLATRYPELADFSDAELLRYYPEELLAEIRQRRATEHAEVAGWGGVPGECGVECACGVTFDGFDTLAGAAELLDHHIADATHALARTDIAERTAR